jgi:hypothetical protein
MKLRSIALNNLRRFTAPVEIIGLSDGLNVLSAPNEQGKSTLFDGLQALFFIAHSGSPKDIKALQPHAKGAPEVRVEVETPDGRFIIAKRWLSKARATVHRDGRLIAQADEAEAWITRLAAADAGGPGGLLWVRQGVTGFADGTAKDLKLQREARRDLLSSVAGEVEAMTGGQRMDAALKRCRAELDLFATTTGKPKVGGPWKAAHDRVARLREERDKLAGTADELHAALTARKRARADLAEVEDPDAMERRKHRLASATEAQAAAQRHADLLETLARGVDTARLRLDGVLARRATLKEATAECTEALALARQAAATRDRAAAAQTEAEQAAQAARDALVVARATLAEADKGLQAAQLARRARDSAARRAELTTRLSDAEGLQAQANALRAAATTGPTANDLKSLERLAARLDQARALRAATATRLHLAYDSDRAGYVTQDGAPLPDATSLPVMAETRLHLRGIGTLTVTPPTTGEDDGGIAGAQAALDTALRRLEVDSLDTARATAETRVRAERDLAQAQAALGAIVPKGIDALRADLASLPAPVDTTETPDLEAAEAARSSAEAERVEMESRFEAARESLDHARTALARDQAAAAAATDRLNRARAAQERVSQTTDQELAVEMQRAEAALADASAAHAKATGEAPDLDSTGAALARARSAHEAAEQTIARLRPEIARLEERISFGAEGAVEELLAEATQDLNAAEQTLTRIAGDVAVLLRLQSALETARVAARERYFSPVANALRPLLHLLWPEAVLEWDDADLLPNRLVRHGQEEQIDVLSGGAQEQLALLVRLAFARMLAQDGRAAPVILDDALVYTDDDRIERMFDALHRQASDVQILVLTCRQRAFRDLGGTQLRFQPLAGEQDSLLDR